VVDLWISLKRTAFEVVTVASFLLQCTANVLQMLMTIEGGRKRQMLHHGYLEILQGEGKRGEKGGGLGLQLNSSITTLSSTSYTAPCKF